METIVVPVDGASNIKLEVLDYDTLSNVFSRVTDSPSKEFDGLKYNSFGEECALNFLCLSLFSSGDIVV